MKTPSRHFWRLLFPRQLPTLRRAAIVIQPFQPPIKENHHVHHQLSSQKTRRAGSQNR